MPRAFLLAAPSSGSGKTTIMMGLLAALRNKYTIQPYKAGPDYIDNAWHTRIVGRPSVNLDTWMSSTSFVKETFSHHARSADIVMIEGVMGLFAGKGGASEEGSSSHLAKILDVPVVLVVDAGMSARSVGAIVLGCELYDPDVKFAGVIVNRIANENHFQTVKESIEKKSNIPFLGYVKKMPPLHYPNVS